MWICIEMLALDSRHFAPGARIVLRTGDGRLLGLFSAVHAAPSAPHMTCYACHPVRMRESSLASGVGLQLPEHEHIRVCVRPPRYAAGSLPPRESTRRRPRPRSRPKGRYPRATPARESTRRRPRPRSRPKGRYPRATPARESTRRRPRPRSRPKARYSHLRAPSAYRYDRDYLLADIVVKIDVFHRARTVLCLENSLCDCTVLLCVYRILDGSAGHRARPVVLDACRDVLSEACAAVHASRRRTKHTEHRHECLCNTQSEREFSKAFVLNSLQPS